MEYICSDVNRRDSLRLDKIRPIGCPTHPPVIFSLFSFLLVFSLYYHPPYDALIPLNILRRFRL